MAVPTAQVIDLAPLVSLHSRQKSGQEAAQIVVALGLIVALFWLSGRAALALLLGFVVCSLFMLRGHRWPGLILFAVALSMIATAVSWLGYDTFLHQRPADSSDSTDLTEQNRWLFWGVALGGGLAGWFLLRGLQATLTRHRLLPPPPVDTANRAKAWIWAGKRLLGRWQAWVFLAVTLAAVLPVGLFALVLLIDLALFDRLWLFNRIDITGPLRSWGVAALPWWLGLILTTFCALALLALGVTGFGRFRRHLEEAAASAQRRDPRPPILLLRSFSDDAQTVWPTHGLHLSRSLNTLEHSLERELRVHGPVIAIGRPGESLPPLGAAREYLAGEAWRARVRSLIGQAQLVVVVMGASEGLIFEYDLLAELEAGNKLLLVLPPDQESELRPGWDRFARHALQDEEVTPPDLEATIVALFPRDRAPIYVEHAKRGAMAEHYRLALQVALQHRDRTKDLNSR